MNPARRKWVLFGATVLVVFACFVPDLRNALLGWDDAGYITENVRIRALSGSTVYWAFTEFHCNYWAPLTWLSLALDYAVWGLDPVGYHLTNDILHALNAGMVFLVARRLLLARAVVGDAGHADEPGALLASAALSAVFFGIHPLRVESVAWAAERKDVLSVGFGIGAVLAYLGRAAAKQPSQDCGGWARFLREPLYWLMLLLYALSLSSKAMLVTLPVVLLVVDWFPLGRLRRGSVGAVLAEKLPMLGLAALSSAVTMRAMAPTSKTLAEIALPTRLLVAFGAIAQYLRLTILPRGISPVYFHPGNVSLDAGHVVAIAVVGSVTALCLYTARRWPALLAAWLVYLIALVPVIGFAQNGPQEMAARFTYVPSVALSVLAAAGGHGLWSGSLLPSRVRNVLPAGALVLLALLAAITVREIGVWKDDVALWSRVIDLQPHRFGRAYFQRSASLSEQGRFREALADANEALSIAARKGYPGIHENYAQVGRILARMGETDLAVDYIGKAIEVAEPPLREHYQLERDGLRARRAGYGEGPGPAAEMVAPVHGGT